MNVSSLACWIVLVGSGLGRRACFQRRLGKATGLASTYLSSGTSHLDRSYSCSYSHRNGPGPFCHKGMSAETGEGKEAGSRSESLQGT